jgi:hypothetical protein
VLAGMTVSIKASVASSGEIGAPWGTPILSFSTETIGINPSFLFSESQSGENPSHAFVGIIIGSKYFLINLSLLNTLNTAPT